LTEDGERWLGGKGSEAPYRGRPCRTRRCGSLGEAIMSASNPDFFDAGEQHALDAARAATAWRIWGGACTSYGRIASGRIDVARDTNLKLWGFASLRLIIEGAGGALSQAPGRHGYCRLIHQPKRRWPVNRLGHAVRADQRVGAHRTYGMSIPPFTSTTWPVM
jgi:fructose-1,6-bisphosphatase/inositol monophosphatase family enzyme